METFIASYVECMLWLVPDEDGGKVPEVYAENIAPSAMETVRSDCADFYQSNRETWERGGWSDAQAGHDFYLTRNGHGAGFWDRQFNEDSKTCGTLLTQNCRPYGEQCLYRGDDGMFYVG